MPVKIKFYLLKLLSTLKILDRIPLGLRISNFIFQKIFRLNAKVNTQVHFTSDISTPKNLHFHSDESTKISFAVSGNCYIQAYNKIYLGKNILFAKGLNLISANHSYGDLSTWEESEPIIIGDNVWIAINVTVLPGVKIGNNCIIGAGSVVTKSFHGDNLVIAGNPAKVIKTRITRNIET